MLVGLGDHFIAAVPDTGYSGTLQLPRKVVEKLAPEVMEGAVPGMVLSTSVLGGKVGCLTKLPVFTFGPDTLQGLPIRVVDATPGSFADQMGVVGLNLLCHYVMTFKFSKGELRLKPLGTVQEVTRRSTAGINFALRDGGRLVVLSVVPAGPAASAGIDVGDEILEIEGKPARQLTPADFAALKQLPPGTHVKVIYRRVEGTPVEATLELVSE
jgi:S1-C subfamily serine protease